MGEQEQIPGVPTEWTREDTQNYLAANPLPPDFVWEHRDGGLRAVHPSHTHVKGGYGKWLRETPYFQGLFELIHDVLFHAPQIGGAAWLAERLNEIRRLRGTQEDLF